MCSNEYPAIIYDNGTYTFISQSNRDDPDASVAYWQCKRIVNATGTWTWRVNPGTTFRTGEYIHTADTTGAGVY